jgi:hypothetical protein
MKKPNMKIWSSTTHRLLENRNVEKTIQNRNVEKTVPYFWLWNGLVYVFFFGRINVPGVDQPPSPWYFEISITSLERESGVRDPATYILQTSNSASVYTGKNGRKG